MTAGQKFPIYAALVLVVGLITIAAVVAFSFAPFFSTTRSVKSIEQAKNLAEQYLSRLNQDFRVKEIMEFSNHFYVMVQEKSTGINAFELLVDRSTGAVFYEPGPSMMWNTKYGHMKWRNNSTVSMPISAQNASEYAQKWLEQNGIAAKVEEAEIFYGYYTMDVSRDTRIFGMLSVNGFSGVVWYHSWHGEFVQMVEYL